jgi:hypothetical protein
MKLITHLEVLMQESAHHHHMSGNVQDVAQEGNQECSSSKAIA